jgi:hypothetical protein
MWHFTTMVKDLDQAKNHSMKGLNPAKAGILLYLDRLKGKMRN